MKMVKSLLLGSAAGLVAVAGAQAADLPVKAKAVEYVKICSLYGAGFYYIPGTNTCLGISGFMRFQNSHTDAGGATSNTASLFAAPHGADVRTGGGNSFSHRVRTMVTFDARTQSEYGTLRSVSTVGYTNDVNSAAGTQTIYANRGFIQIAGFTLGKATSYFDFYSAPATSYTATATGDTGDGGWIVMAYTAQFGGGVSATIAAEEPRRTQIVNTAGTAVAGQRGSTGSTNTNTIGLGLGTVLGPTYTNSYVQQRAPDVVANLRLDQSWGSFQVMGALHDVGSGYYGTNGANAMLTGHPSDKLGWAAGAGLRLNLPTGRLETQFTYSQGASRYHIHAQSAAGFYQFASQNFGYGVISDGVFLGQTGAAAGNVGALDLTSVWSVNASYDHRWGPKLKTSIYGSYISTLYNTTANSNLCNAGNSSAGDNNNVSNSLTTGTFGGLASGACDNNWKLWYIGSRTQWDVTKGLYMGFDVLYQKLQTASAGAITNASFSPGGTRPAGAYEIKNQENWSVVFRAHRDFP